MRRTALLAAAIGGLAVSSSFAGFTITATEPTAQGAREARLFRAINDGVTTGTQLKALDLTFSLTGGKAYFAVDDSDFDGTGDTVAIANGGNNNDFSFVRVGTAGQTFIVESTPTGGTVQPNPWAAGVSQFSVVATTTATVNATGLGALFARLVLDPGTSGTITGTMGGDVGNKVPVSFSFGVPPTGTNIAPVIAPVPPQTVVFGSVISSGAPFSVNVVVTDANAADVLALAANPPAGVTIGSITGGGVSPQTFVVQGTVDYSLNGQTVTVPITATDGAGGSTTSSFQLIVVPEPAALSALALGGLFLGRRRK